MMKRAFLLAVLLGYALSSCSQTSCSANAGIDLEFCNYDTIVLSAPPSSDYETPLNFEWSCVDVPAGIDCADLQFDLTDPFRPRITYMPGDWPVGAYTFRFCAECKGSGDFPCDEVQAVIETDITQARFLVADTLSGCSQLSIPFVPPGPGETMKVKVDPSVGPIEVDAANGLITVRRLVFNPNCLYQMTYSISKGGCTNSDTIAFELNGPRVDANGEVVAAAADCPSCSRILTLFGSIPGCGQTAGFTVNEKPPGAEVKVVSPFDPATGVMQVEVSLPGQYRFQYILRGTIDCPEDTVDISCFVRDTLVVELQDFTEIYCVDTFPAKIFSYTFEKIPDAVYEWRIVPPTNVPPSLWPLITDPYNFQSDVIFLSPIAQQGLFLPVQVRARRYFLDPDCGGPLPPELVKLPYQDPDSNYFYIQNEILPLELEGYCIEVCNYEGNILFLGAPLVQANKDTLFLLCSDGSEQLKISDYVTIDPPILNALDVYLLEQPPGGGLPGQFKINDVLNIDIMGDYRFLVEGSLNSDLGICSAFDTVSFFIRQPEKVTAGTDQIKCVGDPSLLLNGNVPFDGVPDGRWQQVNCLDCRASFDDPADPNTPVILNAEACPGVFYFEWAIENDDDCTLKDTTAVFLDCCTDCRFSLDIGCLYPELVLTLLDNAGQPVDTAEYQVNWIIDGQPVPGAGNPLILQQGAQQSVQVRVSKEIAGILTCDTTLADSIPCILPPPCEHRFAAKYICGNVCFDYLVRIFFSVYLDPVCYGGSFRVTVVEGGRFFDRKTGDSIPAITRSIDRPLGVFVYGTAIPFYDPDPDWSNNKFLIEIFDPFGNLFQSEVVDMPVNCDR